MRSEDAAGAPHVELRGFLESEAANPVSEGAPNSLSGLRAALILGTAPFFWNPPAWVVALMHPQISAFVAPAFLAIHPWPLLVSLGRDSRPTDPDGRANAGAGSGMRRMR